MKPKSPTAALLLSLIPGVGHAYIGRPIRSFVYAGFFFGALGFMFLILATGNGMEPEMAFFLFAVAFVAAAVNFFDMIFTLIKGTAPGLNGAPHGYGPGAADIAAAHGGYEAPGYTAGGGYASPVSYEQQKEKTRTILMSFIPGLGQMGLGLMQRGITFLIASIGLFIIIVFLSIIMNSGVVLLFLFLLPVIWIYSLFDAISLVHAKHSGETLEDKSLFEELEAHIASGRKNKVLTIALSVFPGVGHLYLGLQKRGLQLMGGFLLSIYIMDNMRLTLFLFLLPLFWCFSFFDALQQMSRYERQTMSDEPVLSQLVPYQKWFGFALLGFGLYYLFDRVAIETTQRFWPEMYQPYLQLKYMFPTAITAFIMIIIGLRLAFGGQKTVRQEQLSPPPPIAYEEGEGKQS